MIDALEIGILYDPTLVWFALPHGEWVKEDEEECQVYWKPNDNQSEKGDN